MSEEPNPECPRELFDCPCCGSKDAAESDGHQICSVCGWKPSISQPETPALQKPSGVLTTLSVLHTLLAGLLLLVLPVIFFIALIVFTGGREGPGPQPQSSEIMPPIIGAAVLGLTLIVCMFIVSSKLRQRKAFTFCAVIAAIECLVFPLGTVLGVATLMVLASPKKQLSANQKLHPVLKPILLFLIRVAVPVWVVFPFTVRRLWVSIELWRLIEFMAPFAILLCVAFLIRDIRRLKSSAANEIASKP